MPFDFLDEEVLRSLILYSIELRHQKEYNYEYATCDRRVRGPRVFVSDIQPRQ